MRVRKKLTMESRTQRPGLQRGTREDRYKDGAKTEILLEDHGCLDSFAAVLGGTAAFRLPFGAGRPHFFCRESEDPAVGELAVSSAGLLAFPGDRL